MLPIRTVATGFLLVAACASISLIHLSAHHTTCSDDATVDRSHTLRGRNRRDDFNVTKSTLAGQNTNYRITQGASDAVQTPPPPAAHPFPVQTDARKQAHLKRLIRSLAHAQLAAFRQLEADAKQHDPLQGARTGQRVQAAPRQGDKTLTGPASPAASHGDGVEDGTRDGEVRAVVVELGADRAKFLTEFKWLFRSWIDVRQTEMAVNTKTAAAAASTTSTYMASTSIHQQGAMAAHDAPYLVTDLVVCTDMNDTGLMSALEGLGCHVDGLGRRSRTEAPACHVHSYTRLSVRAKSDPSDDMAHDLRHYNYVDSINVVADYNGYAYDVLLRSDLDTFLAPDWASTRLATAHGPAPAILVGQGYYIVDGPYQTRARLEFVAQRLGLHATTVDNLGTTWGGPRLLAQATARLQVQIVRWLDLYEFTAFDRREAGTSGWPNWHWGVLTLYAGHLALNNVPRLHHVPHLLDHDTTDNTQPLVGSGVLHMHVLHGNVSFSKSELSRGAYDNVDLASLDTTTARGYATHTALEAGRLPSKELKRMLTSYAAKAR
eukprot:m.135691 g.135691  ORF g.135691 m.135691 type:complete len:548 (+) comp11422_c0_seq1:488-2131(+)